jgi:hypothetical protein
MFLVDLTKTTFSATMSIRFMSLKRMTSLCMNYTKKILTLSDTLLFQIYFLRSVMWPLSMSMHVNLMVKNPEVVKFKRKTSSFSVNWTIMTLETKWTSLSHLLADKTRLKPMFRGVKPITFTTVALLWLTILYCIRLDIDPLEAYSLTLNPPKT